jgi:hypothetical protein
MAREGSGGRDIEPIGVELSLLEPDGPEIDEVLSAGGRRPRFGRARERTPRPMLTAPAGLVEFATKWQRRWTGLAPRRRRRFTLIALAAVVLLVGAVVTLARPGPMRPFPVVAIKPHPSAVPLPRSTYDPMADVASPVGPPLTTPGGAVRDVAIASDDLYVLSASAISVVDAYSRQILRQADFTPSANARLVLDIADGTMWVVDIDTAPAVVREFDLVSLQPTRTVAVSGVIYDAVEQDQSLFVATSGGVFLVAPLSSQLTAVGSTIPEPQALAADPVADTVLAVSSGTNARITTFANAGATMRAGPTLNVTNPTIAIMKQALWVGGVNPDARLLRVDQNTLRPLPDSAGGALIDEGADSQLQISAGAMDLWVYSHATGDLACVDSTTGDVLQRWSGITQSVATGGSGPYAVTGGTVAPLVLRGNCFG